MATKTVPLDFNDLAASPASPASGFLRVFAKAGKLLQKDSSGTETDLTLTGTGGATFSTDVFNWEHYK